MACRLLYAFLNSKHLNNKIQQKEQEFLNLKNNNFTNIIQYYQNIISQKDQEIFNLKNNQQNNRGEKFYIDQIMAVNFISMDGSLHYCIPCTTTDIFAEIEEKLYKKFPKYRETNNYFLYNGKNILRFKTIGENKIENGMPITLCVPQ
jgi:type I restriction-modification system DNA methylase subunit